MATSFIPQYHIVNNFYLDYKQRHMCIPSIDLLSTIAVVALPTGCRQVPPTSLISYEIFLCCHEIHVCCQEIFVSFYQICVR